MGRARAQRGAHEQPSSPAALLAGLGFVAISRCSGFGSHAGPMVRILFPPPGEPVSPVPYRATGARGPAFAGSVSLDETREQDVQATSPSTVTDCVLARGYETPRPAVCGTSSNGNCSAGSAGR
jgi:hypothetical protein